MVKNKVNSKLPFAILTRIDPILSPKPVCVTTPIMIPAQAQAAITVMALLAPLIKPSTTSIGLSRVSFLSAEHTIEAPIAPSAALIGV